MELIIPLILAIVSYFSAKKSGASDGEAALVGLGVGAASYYVATETEWGQETVKSMNEWVGLTDSSDTVILDGEGNPAIAPANATPVLNAAGEVVRDSAGNPLWNVVDTAGNVLESWGGVGTAAVIGATGVATGSIPTSYLWIGAAVAAFALLS